MVTIEVSCLIKKPKQEVFKAIKDMESFPSIMRDIKNLKIIKRLSEDKFVTAWETEIDGAPVTWKEEDTFDENNFILKFEMIEGNYQTYQGQWVLHDAVDATKLTIKADFDWGIPILEEYVGKTLEEKARRSLLGMAQAIKNKVEKNPCMTTP